jgi:sulfite exporter TauE/SafE
MFQVIDPVFIIFFPAFLIGILHTALPCEDKAIFFFWSFGIAKDAKKSLAILILYGFGLISSNMIIAFVSVLITLIPEIFGLNPSPFFINFMGALSSLIAALLLLFLIIFKDYIPHSKLKEEIIQLDWDRYRTPFLFGILTGFTPCIFELIIYSQCVTLSLSYNFIPGILTVFYFSLGTFVGLFPLALAQLGTSQIFKHKKFKQNKIYIIMIVIIVIFNIIVLILSLFEIHVFPLYEDGYAA